MTKKCVACEKPFIKGGNISFHLFPKDNSLKALWLAALDLDEWDITPHSVVCSKHFSSNDIELDKFCGLRRLKTVAVPQRLEKNPCNKNERLYTAPSRIYKGRMDNNKNISLQVEPATNIINTNINRGALHVRSDHDYAINFEKTSLCTKCGHSLKKKVEVKATQTEVQGFGQNELQRKMPSSVFVPGKRKSSFESPRYIGDLREEHFSTPQQTSIHLKLVKSIFLKQQKKMRELCDQKRNLKKRNISLTALLQQRDNKR